MESVSNLNMEQASNEENLRLSLYVGGLHKDVNEAELSEKFYSIEDIRIASIHICRDYNKKSLGYGYVNFLCSIEAQKALEMMNYELLRGIPMRVMWSQRNPNLRTDEKSNLFIKNLDPTIDCRKLDQIFARFGNVLSCKIALDQNNKSKGFGFVQFENEEAANKAIKEVHGTQLENKIVHVERFISRADRLKQFEAAPFFNIYVKNFSEDITEEVLIEKFQSMGKITSLTIMRDENQNSRKFGFIAFEDSSSAKKAVTELNGIELTEGMPLYVGRALTKSQRKNELNQKYRKFVEESDRRHKDCNLYVKHLEGNTGDSDLQELFAQFGNITSAKVMKKGDQSRGFGFVCYSNAEAAQQALIEMNGKSLGSKPLYVAVAQRREARTAELIKKFQEINAIQYTTRTDQQYYLPGSSLVVNPPDIPSTSYGSTSQYVNNTTRQSQNAQKSRLRKRQPHNKRRTVGNTPPTTPVVTVPQRVPTSSIEDFPPLNRNRQPQMIPVQVVQEPQIAVGPVTNYSAAVRNTAQQKQMLGERLYKIVMEIYPDVAPKITGMILEMPQADLVMLLDDSDSLKSKIEEAFNILKEYEKNQTKCN